MYNSSDPERRIGVETTSENGLLRADRRRLREWLRANIAVQYSKQVVAVEEDNGDVIVRFQYGTEARGSMVVGADGTHSVGMLSSLFLLIICPLISNYFIQYRLLTSTSKFHHPVRHHLFNGKPDPLQDVPIASIVGEVELSGDDLIYELELAHSGTVIVHPAENPEDYVMTFIGLNEVRPYAKSALYYWLVYFQNDENFPSREAYDKACASRETLLEMAKDKTKDFHSAFRRAIDRTSVEGMKFPPMVLRGMVLSAEDIPAGSVTLLGDAAYYMIPYR